MDFKAFIKKFQRLIVSPCAPICAQLLLENEQMQIERPGSRAALKHPLPPQRTRLRMAAEDVAAARHGQQVLFSYVFIICQKPDLHLFGNRHRLEQPNEIKKAWVWAVLGD